MGEIFTSMAADRPGGVFACMEEAVAEARVGAGGVIYHPFLRGERAPFMNPSARAGFYGIGADTTRAELARAVYEGVGFAIRDCLDHTGTQVEEVMLAGGGAKSPVWCQILADATGRTMRIPRGSEFGTLGAAVAAGIGIGLFDGYEDAVRRSVRVERSYTPRPEVAGRYQGLYHLYRDLVTALETFWEKREGLIAGWVERKGRG
jgi:sugar (pentulose or hexulose) kinase